jgi:hypothetical protein
LELRKNKKDKEWSFQGRGLSQLTEDFVLLNEHLNSSKNDRLSRLCTSWGKFALSYDDRARIEQAPENERDNLQIEIMRPLLEPLWSFFVALCHALQEGENQLTATDAFWFGLIDEVIGEKDLPSLRIFAEYEKDPDPDPLPQGPAPAPELPQ